MPTWTCPGARSAKARIDDAFGVFPRLERYRDRGGDALSGGERKMLALSRQFGVDQSLRR